MTRQKDLKRLARRRMKKTGEAYTTARLQILEKRSPLPRDYAKIAGKTDETMREKTGKTWRQWVRVLDAVNAVSMSHGEIATHVYETNDVSGWWSQMITVGYERIRGLRDVGQRREGSYEVSKSKTVAVSVSKLYDAFGNARIRQRWLPEDGLTVRTANRDKTMRIKWRDGTAVDVYFVAKGPSKSQVTVQHRKLEDRAAADRAREFWARRLNALAELLA